MGFGKAERCQGFRDRLGGPLSQLRHLVLVSLDQLVELTFDFLPVERIEHPADDFGHFALYALPGCALLGIFCRTVIWRLG